MEATRALTLIQIRMANCLITNYMKYELTLMQELKGGGRGAPPVRRRRPRLYLFLYRCGDTYTMKWAMELYVEDK